MSLLRKSLAMLKVTCKATCVATCSLTMLFAVYTGLRYAGKRYFQRIKCQECKYDLVTAISKHHTHCVETILQEKVRPYQAFYSALQQCYLCGKQWFEGRVIESNQQRIETNLQNFTKEYPRYAKEPNLTHFKRLIEKQYIHVAYQSTSLGVIPNKWLPLIVGVCREEEENPNLQLDLSPDMSNAIVNQYINGYIPEIVKVCCKYNNVLAMLFFTRLRFAADGFLNVIDCVNACFTVPNCLTYATSTVMVDTILQNSTVSEAWIKFAMEWHLLHSHERIYLYLKALNPTIEPNMFKYFVKQPKHHVYRNVDPTYEQKCIIRDWMESEPSRLSHLVFDFLPTTEFLHKTTMSHALQQKDGILLNMCIKHSSGMPWFNCGIGNESLDSFDVFSKAVLKTEELTPTEWVIKNDFIKSIQGKAKPIEYDDTSNGNISFFNTDSETFQPIKEAYLRIQDEYTLQLETSTNICRDVCRIVAQYN
jgi:hypothetical protein